MELQLKDYPKNLKNRIKANVKAHGGDWKHYKGTLWLPPAFVWVNTHEGFDFWDVINSIANIEDLEAISRQLK